MTERIMPLPMSEAYYEARQKVVREKRGSREPEKEPRFRPTHVYIEGEWKLW